MLINSKCVFISHVKIYMRRVAKFSKIIRIIFWIPLHFDGLFPNWSIIPLGSHRFWPLLKKWFPYKYSQDSRCRSMQINTDQKTGIDSKYLSLPIIANQCRSIPLNTSKCLSKSDQSRSVKHNFDGYWQTLGSDPGSPVFTEKVQKANRTFYSYILFLQ